MAGHPLHCAPRCSPLKRVSAHWRGRSVARRGRASIHPLHRPLGIARWHPQPRPVDPWMADFASTSPPCLSSDKRSVDAGAAGDRHQASDPLQLLAGQPRRGHGIPARAARFRDAHASIRPGADRSAPGQRRACAHPRREGRPRGPLSQPGQAGPAPSLCLRPGLAVSRAPLTATRVLACGCGPSQWLPAAAYGRSLDTALACGAPASVPELTRPSGPLRSGPAPNSTTTPERRET